MILKGKIRENIKQILRKLTIAILFILLLPLLIMLDMMGMDVFSDD